MRKYNFSTGGKAAVDRVMKVYGFRFKTELANHLGLTNSTIATWIQRDHFPAEVIIQCALETGVNLEWLATGNGEMGEKEIIQDLILERKIIEGGIANSIDKILFDSKLLPANIKNPLAIKNENLTYIITPEISNIANGQYLIEIEGKLSINDIERIPVNKLRISEGELKMPIECGIDDIKILGRVVMVCEEK